MTSTAAVGARPATRAMLIVRVGEPYRAETLPFEEHHGGHDGYADSAFDEAEHDIHYCSLDHNLRNQPSSFVGGVGGVAQVIGRAEGNLRQGGDIRESDAWRRRQRGGAVCRDDDELFDEEWGDGEVLGGGRV